MVLEQHINFEESEFYNKTFTGLAAPDMELSGKEFETCTFHSCDFSAALFKHCKFTDCQFISCNLSVLQVTNSKFSNVEFQDCKMLGIDWTKAHWRGLALGAPLCFRRCLLNSSSFYGLNQTEAVFDECLAHDVDFREANLARADFSASDLANSLFGNTNLTEANFYLAVNYDIDIKTNIIKNAKFSRSEAVRLLDSLDIDLID